MLESNFTAAGAAVQAGSRDVAQQHVLVIQAALGAANTYAGKQAARASSTRLVVFFVHMQRLRRGCRLFAAGRQGLRLMLQGRAGCRKALHFVSCRDQQQGSCCIS